MSNSPSRDAALVTGASGGIGEEIAKLLAEKGHDLVLVARTADRLRRLAQELSTRHSVRVEAIPADLAAPSAPEQLVSALQTLGLQPAVLVNNAGFGAFGPFADSELETDLGQIQLNVTALTHLTRRLLPAMIAAGRGRILNVASTAAFQPGPLMAVYYATKAYVLSFSEALAVELKGTGVTVTCLCPGPTQTGFMKRARMGDPPKSATMDAAAVARKGVQAMMKGRRLLIPGALNKILAHSTRLVSRGLSAKIVRSINETLRTPAP